MFKIGDILKYRSDTGYDFNLGKRWIVYSESPPGSKEVTMLDYDDISFMILGRKEFLELDLNLTRKRKIDNILKRNNFVDV